MSLLRLRDGLQLQMAERLIAIMPHSPRHNRCAAKSESPSALETLAIILFSTIEDDDDELAATALAMLALEDRKKPGGKFGSRGSYNREKSKDFFDLVIYNYTERQFKRWLRVTRDTFWHLHDLIKDDPLFQSKDSQRPQRPVHHQLAAFLCRFGAEDALKASCVMAIAEGTVYMYGSRVCHAFRNMRDAYISWPDTDRRNAIKEETSKLGFPGCIGIADGTLFRLTNKPFVEGESYWCRKKFYGLAVQVVCDHMGIIQSYELGWPGSVSDVTMFQESHLWLNKETYFAEDEYILVDRGYPLTKYTIRPFSDFDLTNDQGEAEWRKLWNQKLSSLRVTIENAFGRLKERFPCLRNFAVRDLQQAYRIIESIFVIHNIVELLQDDMDNIGGFELNDNMEPEEENIWRRDDREMLDDNELYRAGVARRKMLLDMFRNV